MSNVVIQTNGLTRTYRIAGGASFNAVDSLDLEIRSGEIFAFLGVNGAGKTTTMKMLLGLTFPTSGEFNILGGSITNRSIRKRIGYLPEESGLYPFLRVVDVLKFYARLFGNSPAWRKERVEVVLEFSGLTEKRNEQIKNLSKGMRQRIGIAQALINDPELIFLDEPASGLDPIGIKDLREMMARLKDAGKTVFLNSHQLSEVEMVADRIGMLREGKLLRIGKIKDLLAMEGGVEIKISNITIDNARKLIGRLEIDEDTWDVVGTAKSLTVELDNDDHTDKIISLLIENGASIGSVNKQSRNLEGLFSEVMQNG